MTNTIITKNLKEIKKNLRRLEKKLKIKIELKGKELTFEGDPLDEYEALIVFDAINSGFSAETSLLILEPDFVFEKINIKDYTRRKNLNVIKGRLIGTHGKTKNTLQQISECFIRINENTVVIIGEAESVKNAITAIINIIKGSKQSNTYKYLERINTKKRKIKLM